MVSALKQLQARCVDECPQGPDFINLMVRVHNTCNGVTNCIHHILGSMVKKMIDKSKLETTSATLDEIVDRMEALKYLQYIHALQSCGCESCVAVVDFDGAYKRYARSAAYKVHARSGSAITFSVESTFPCVTARVLIK